MSTENLSLAISLIGPPTCAKTSVAEDLAKNLGYKLIRGQSILPDLVPQYAPNRKLIPDPTFVPALLTTLSQANSPRVVLDNIPRTVRQASEISRWSQTQQRQLQVFHLRLTEEQVVDRSTNRLICPQCHSSFHPILKPTPTPGLCPHHHDQVYLQPKPGDTPDVVRQGYQDHLQSDLPIINLLQTLGATIHEVDASGTVPQTFSLVSALLAI